MPEGKKEFALKQKSTRWKINSPSPDADDDDDDDDDDSDDDDDDDDVDVDDDVDDGNVVDDGGGDDKHKYTIKERMSNMRIVEVAGDGNCLYRAVVHQFNSNKDEDYLHFDHKDIRRMVCEYELENRAMFEEFIDPLEYKNFDERLSEQKEENTWANEPELRAIELAFGRRITVYNALSGTVTDRPSVSAAASEAPPILIHYNGIHYNSVIENKKRKR